MTTKIHKDSWKQVLELNDYVMFGTSRGGLIMGQIVRMSDGGTWWVKALPQPGYKLSQEVRWLRSERTISQKILVDDVVMTSLTISERFLTPPVIRVSLE